MTTHNYISADEHITALIKKSEQSTKPLGSSQSLYDILNGESYTPHEDYIQFKDGSIATTLSLDFEYGKTDPLPLQWGVEITALFSKLIEKTNLTFLQITTVNPMSKDWLKKADSATKAVKSVEGDVDEKTLERLKTNELSASIKRRGLRNAQINQIRYELENDGAQYLATAFKFWIKAPNIEEFDEFYKELKFKLRQDLKGFKIISHLDGGENVFNTLFVKPLDDLGKPAMFTSNEFAGYYPLLSQGISDPNGMYVGEQVGDINNMSVLWDMTLQLANENGKYAVFLGNDKADTITSNTSGNKTPIFETHYASGNSLWLHELVKQYLLLTKSGPSNIDTADKTPSYVATVALSPYELSPSMQKLTEIYNLNEGILNPLENFKIRNREADINAVINEKWEAILRELGNSSMARTTTDISDSVISTFKKTLSTLHTDFGMRGKTLNDNSKRTRFSGLYHSEYPTLLDLRTTIESEYTASINARSNKQDSIKAQELNTIKSLIDKFESENGDIFNVYTSIQIDKIRENRHDLFDLSHLKERSGIIQMVQLINSIDLILHNLKENDLLILYGCDEISNFGHTYLIKQLKDAVQSKHIKVACFYNNFSSLTVTEKGDRSARKTIITDSELDILNNTGYVLLGQLTSGENIAAYNTLVANKFHISDKISTALSAENNLQLGLKSTTNTRYYLRRGFENVVFDANPLIS